MRKSTVIAFLAVVAALSLTTAAQAAKIVNTTVPVSKTVAIPCTGDSVQFSGMLHIVMTLTTNKNFVIGTMHMNAQDVHGTSASGIAYRSTGTANTRFKVGLKNGSAMIRTSMHLKATGKGGKKASITLSALFLVNAKGKVLSRSVGLAATC